MGAQHQKVTQQTNGSRTYQVIRDNHEVSRLVHIRSLIWYISRSDMVERNPALNFFERSQSAVHRRLSGSLARECEVEDMVFLFEWV